VLKIPQTDAAALTQLIQNHKRPQLLGRLRNALALAVIREIEPDLIIFDEFQKFRTLLINTSNPNPDAVTQFLRGGGPAPAPAVLLLSATPYRLYSPRHQELIGTSHYQEFVELIRFLLRENPGQPGPVERYFREFGIEMQSPAANVDRLKELKQEIESRVRPVMRRTERIQPSGVAAKIPCCKACNNRSRRSEGFQALGFQTARFQWPKNGPARGSGELCRALLVLSATTGANAWTGLRRVARYRFDVEAWRAWSATGRSRSAPCPQNLAPSTIARAERAYACETPGSPVGEALLTMVGSSARMGRSCCGGRKTVGLQPVQGRATNACRSTELRPGSRRSVPHPQWL
jgi:hypothetical protein